MKEELLAALKKYWWVGAVALAVLFLLLRRRPSAPSVSAVPSPALQQGTPEGTMGDTLSGIAKQLQDAAAGTALREQRFAQQEIDTQSRLMEGATKIQEEINRLILGKVSGTLTKEERRRVKCPSGDFHIDPETRQPYCRQEQSHGFFGDVVKPALGTAFQTYASGGFIRGVGGSVGGVKYPDRNRPGTTNRAPAPGQVLIT